MFEFGRHNVVEKTGDTIDYAWSVHDGGIAAPVPEPATMFLAGSGIIGLAGVRKK